MHLIQSGLRALIALSIISGVISTPVDVRTNTSVLVALDSAVSALLPQDQVEQRDIADIDQSPSVATISTIGLAERAGPPTYQDFVNFFKSKQRVGSTNNLVFWSGVGVQNSQNFAQSHGRQTLEMIVGRNWELYQTDRAHQGYWASWDDAVNNFWNPISRACAQYATGEVYFFATRELLQDQTRPSCPKCWYREEKPALVASLQSSNTLRVTKISKYAYPDRQDKPSIGEIRSMSD